jgi:hypothetical protein
VALPTWAWRAVAKIARICCSLRSSNALVE